MTVQAKFQICIISILDILETTKKLRLNLIIGQTTGPELAVYSCFLDGTGMFKEC
ncbi:hypothetical protein HanIR_Chr12g0593831 [Helianthus annuus]|nr:hypothetical protein HanIR_Chr12g0593831 [Helianthus annuus]